MGAPIHIPMGAGVPMGPPAPPMGNLHAFDPFLPCSSHHVANGRAGARTNVRAAQRDVRRSVPCHSFHVSIVEKSPIELLAAVKYFNESI